MTAIAKGYRFRVYETDGTTVEWTETVDIADVGPVGGQQVEAKSARTSAAPWSVAIVDVAEDITARLADSDGRAQLLRRLCDLSVTTDGGSSYTVLATGRVDTVEMIGVAAFMFGVQDERLIERTTTIFRAGNTTRLAPTGLISAWLDFQAGTPFRFVVVTVDAVNNKTTYHAIGYTRPRLNEDGMRLRDDALDFMEDDVLDVTTAHGGNFTNLRVSIDGTDREIQSFNSSPVRDPLKGLRDQDNDERRVWSFVVAGYQDPGGVDQVRDCYLHMSGRDPAEGLPLHIGGQAGVDPFALVKSIYDGSYQDSSNPATVRYDSDALGTYNASTNPDGLVGRFPRMHFRITGSENMAQWLEANIYGPLGVVPFVNAAGEVAPKIARMPAIDQIDDPDNLFEFNAANLKTQPGWLNQGRDQVTVVRVTFEYARAAGPRETESDTALDGLLTGTTTLTREHDNVGTAGRMIHEMRVIGVHRHGGRREFATRVAREMFDRFGDGPIYTSAWGLSATESVQAGDWVVLDLDTYPALQNQSRSGKRLMQVLARIDHPEGPEFPMIEGGPSSQPLGTPSVSIAANSDLPENAVDVTISGLGTGEGYELNLAIAGSEPSGSSEDWQYRVIRGTANETLTVGQIPAGSTVWGRVRATKLGRISSDWSTADSQATTALTAPSSFADADVTADRATLTWTLGETDFDLLLDLGGTPYALLQAGTTSFELEGLEASTSYTFGLKHVDPYGGESSRVTNGVTTTSGASAVPAMAGIRVLVGA